MEYKPKYETFSFPTQISDITSPLFLRFVNQCIPFVGKSFDRQGLYMRIVNEQSD